MSKYEFRIEIIISKNKRISFKLCFNVNLMRWCWWFLGLHSPIFHHQQRFDARILSVVLAYSLDNEQKKNVLIQSFTSIFTETEKKNEMFILNLVIKNDQFWQFTTMSSLNGTNHAVYVIRNNWSFFYDNFILRSRP